MNILRAITSALHLPASDFVGGRRVRTITEDLTLFTCQREHARQDREARRRTTHTIRIGKETHILGGTSSGMSHYSLP